INTCRLLLLARGIGLWMLCYLVLTAAMYFDLGEQEEKCLIEEIPGDMLVTGEFYGQLEKRTLFCMAEFHYPNHDILMKKRYGRFGKFTFTSHASGPHWLCMQSNSTRFSVFAGERLRIHFDVQMGEHSIDPSVEIHKDTVQTMEYSLEHLRDQILYITRQQDFQREREETFRQISEETNGKVLWWAVVQTSVLLSVGFWQIKRLKDFLIAKKLV
uniref:Si:ch211-255i20.3 n=1 Tax=Salmo trutta TaxID=8032 RepID=A0A674DY78_SALTR